MPGQTVNLGEGGMAAALPGEIIPGEAVGVEFRLPFAAEPVRARAVVRHHNGPGMGMEFVELSHEERMAIRGWMGKSKEKPQSKGGGKTPARAGSGPATARPDSGEVTSRFRYGRGWIFLLLSVAILLGVLWWRWNRGWEELESGLQTSEKKQEPPRPEAHVPADVMEKLVTHRVDPDYPAAARPGKLQGVIVLDVTIGRDGSVVDMHAINGPEILAEAAMDALRWWRFEPYRVDGQAVVVETTVAVEFKP